jgi:hypothetical protein
VRARAALGAVGVLLLAGSARASDFEVGLAGGYFDFVQASNSANAVFGSSGGFVFGADASFALSHKLYLGFGGRFFTKDGERVFVAGPGSQVFPLVNEPLSARLVPLEATIGLRFMEGKTIRPYLGVGPGLTLYHEESTVGGVTTSLDETKFSAHIVAGLEFGQRDVRFGLELNFAIVPNAIGVGGVSQVYNEKDLGGLTVLGRIVFGRAHHSP